MLSPVRTSGSDPERLLIERLAVADDLTVSARNYAASLSGWLAATFVVIDRERRTAQTALANTESTFQELTYTLGQFPEGTASPAYDAANVAWRDLTGQRRPHTDRLNALTMLESLIQAFASKAIPGKIVNGKPSDGSIRLFVDSAKEAA